MVSTSGHRLLPEDAVRILRERLLPLTTILTPNIPESLVLLQSAGSGANSPKLTSDFAVLASKLQSIVACGYVLLKGGHVPMTSEDRIPEQGEVPAKVVDVLVEEQSSSLFESPYSVSRDIHGTGCSLASAIAANLAMGKAAKIAVRDACRYVQVGIETSFELGHGNGPINHFHSLQVLPFAPGFFLDYLIGRPDIQPLWRTFTQHKFVRAIGDGSLPLDVFKRFLIQDYLYLTQFARTNALAAYKSSNMEDIAASAQIVLGVQKEMELHLEYCQEFSISKQEMEAAKESQATVAYSRYVLDIGQSGDWLGLQVAMASCLVGYQVAAEWVKAQPWSRREGNGYWKWVDNYGGEEYAEAVRLGREMIERYASKISPQRLEELVRIFIRVTEMEVNFWEFDAHLK